MSVLSGFLNQTVRYSKRIGLNFNGEPLYGPEQVIPARVERRTRWAMTPDGRVIDNYTAVTIEGRAELGDRIDGEPIESLEDITPMNGKQIGTECYL